MALAQGLLVFPAEATRARGGRAGAGAGARPRVLRRGAGRLSEGRFADVAGALLLGGASERMGADKARLALAGEAAAVRTRARCSPSLFEEVLLVGGEPPADAPGRARRRPAGPALRAARPGRRARGGARAARAGRRDRSARAHRPSCCSRWSRCPRPTSWCRAAPRGARAALRALPREPVLPAARARLARGRARAARAASASSAARRSTATSSRAFDPDGAALANVNTPEDWALARAPPRRREAPMRRAALVLAAVSRSCSLRRGRRRARLPAGHASAAARRRPPA